VRAYANGFIDHQGVHFRDQDYARFSDYARLLRFFTVGNKEEPLYLGVSQLFATSIGHGSIVRRYFGSADQNATRLGAELDVEAKYGGFEAFLGDVARPSHFLAGSAYLKPLAFLQNETWSQTSIGVSTAVDFEAPYTLRRDPSGRPATASDGDPDVVESRRAQMIPQRYDMSIPANQAKLEAAQALGVLAEQAGMSLIEMSLRFVTSHPAVTAAIIGPRTMEQLESQLTVLEQPALPGEVLDRIDEIVPPGVTLNAADAGWANPALEPGARRR